MKPTDYSYDPLIRWVVRYSPVSKYNMSLSGLPEVRFSDFGIDTAYHPDMGDRKGMEKLFREELCKLYGFPEKNVLITTGGSESIFLLSKYFLDRNFSIIEGYPEYPPLFTVPESLGGKVSKHPYSSVREKFRSSGPGNVMFMSNPNNPLGSYIKKGEISSLLRSGGDAPWIYADEAFLEFMLQNRPESLFVDGSNIVINGSMTKFYGFSNFRVGLIVGPEPLIRQLDTLRSITGAQNPSYPLWIATQCLQNREKFQKRARDVVGRDLSLLRSFLSKHSELKLEADPGNVSFCFIKYSFNMDSEAFCSTLLEKTGVLLSPGSYFGVERGFRMCLTQNEKEFADSLEALGKFLETMN